jgi:signal transduction histidine kinase
MTSPAAHAWQRGAGAWHGLFYGLLALVTVITIADDGLDWQRRGAILGLAVLLGVWYTGLIVRRPQWRRQPRPNLIFLGGAALLLAGLNFLHSIFFLFAFTVVWGYTFWLLPMRWAIPTVLALVTVLGGQLVLMMGAPVLFTVQTLAAAGLLAATGLFIALWIDGIIQQSRQRQKLIDELETTRRELAAAERQAGMLAERQRLSREIHDTLAQGFTSIVLHLEAAEQALDSDTVLLQHHLDEARHTARASLAESRRVMMALRPELLETASLPDALRQTVDQWAQAARLTANTAITGAPRPVTSEVETTLLRAAQEALANVRKHAHASAVNVTLSYMDDATALDVQDNGLGFSSRATEKERGMRADGGFGLRALRERVEQLGGSLSIESAPGEGTTLVVELSIQQAHSEASLL